MCLSVGQGESGSPGTPKHHTPLINPKVHTQLLNVPDQRLCVVVNERTLQVVSGVRDALAAAALVNQNYQKVLRVEEPPRAGACASSWAAV